MDIWILTTHHGEYEDKYDSIQGIYEDEEQAEAAKASIVDMYKEFFELEIEEPDTEDYESPEWLAYDEIMGKKSMGFDFAYASIEHHTTIPKIVTTVAN